MKILVYGAGVLGCELASVLCRGDAHVTLLARGSWKETIDQRGLTVRHTLQLRTTRDPIPTVDHLEPHWNFDLIFVVLRSDQLPAALPELARNHSRNLVFIGNNCNPRETEAALLAQSTVEKEVAFGFLSAAGRREGTRVDCTHAGVHLTVGGCTAPLSPGFRKHLEKAARKTPLRCRWEGDMEAWLRCHLAAILPMCYVIYALGGHVQMKLMSRQQRKACLDASLEGCEFLAHIGVPIREADSTDYFRPGCKRMLMELTLLLMVKTPLGPHCAGFHAMNAREEIRHLDGCFEALRQGSDFPMPAWDALRQSAHQTPLRH